MLDLQDKQGNVKEVESLLVKWYTFRMGVVSLQER